DVRDLHLAGGKRIRVDRESVILRGDLHVTGPHIFNGVIRTVVAEFQLVRASSQCQATELVAEAYAEYRHLAEQLSNIFHAITDRLRIPGPIRKEDAIRLHRQDV